MTNTVATDHDGSGGRHRSPGHSADDVIPQLQRSWIWVTDWIDQGSDRAGQRVLFRCVIPALVPMQHPSSDGLQADAGTTACKAELPLTDTPSHDEDDRQLLHITADTRYKLLINGQRVCVGPSRGSDRIWYYDTVDVKPYLVPDRANTIDIQVIRFFPNLPVAHSFGRTRSPGLSVVGAVKGYDCGTSEPSRWRATREEHIRYPFPARLDRYLHTFEDVQASTDQISWTTPVKLHFQNATGVSTIWNLAPRIIPLAEETDLRPLRVRHAASASSAQAWETFLSGGQAGLWLEPGSKHRVEIEYAVHSTAFVRLLARRPGSAGSIITFTYSEAYEQLPRIRAEDPFCPPLKSDRIQRDGHGLDGPADRYEFSGCTAARQSLESYAPFWWKTFRFIALDMEVNGCGLELLAFETKQTNYPLPVQLAIDTPGESMSQKMLEISLRTLRNCIFDGYSDCPFYEQLQYIEDTRSSALFHYYASGDDRLARQAIVAFAASQQPCGILMGRYPSHTPQVITVFSLFWILMVCDHMDHYGEAKWAKQFCPVIDGVLDFFERHVGPFGLVEGLPFDQWRFIDWSVDWDEQPCGNDKGAPIAGRAASRWTYVSMLYSLVLRRAAKFLQDVDRPSLAIEYLSRSRRLNNTVRSLCFDGAFFTDSLARDARPGHYSQHCQIMAVLCGAVENESINFQQALIVPTLSTKTAMSGLRESIKFTQCSYILQHYVFRALAAVQLYDRYFHSMWDPWRKMMSLNLTTWAEGDVEGRSDCHAWSALPLYEFPAEVAGLKPLAPGWAIVGFEPRIDLYNELKMTVPIGPKGSAEVAWQTTVDGKIRVRLVLPEPVTVEVKLRDRLIQRWHVSRLVEIVD